MCTCTHINILTLSPLHTLTLTHPHAYTAYQTTFSCRVIDILSEWGSLYVLLKDGRVRRGRGEGGEVREGEGGGGREEGGEGREEREGKGRERKRREKENRRGGRKGRGGKERGVERREWEVHVEGTGS